jgi:two-component system sensor histidine kinase HydH
MKVSPRYLLASIALLIVLVALYAASVARRTQAELMTQMEQKGLALADAMETGSRAAIRSNALMEEMIAQRLLDNAHLVDELLRGPFDPAELVRIAERNRLSRIELLDLDGRPWAPPPPPDQPLHRRMKDMMKGAPHQGGPAEMQRWMMRYMWGQRWARPPGAEDGEPPRAIRDRKFREGSLFGVAIGAQSFAGIIAVHADAQYVLNFRKEAGVERQIEELGRQAGVVSVALLDPDLTVLVHSDPALVGQRRPDPAFAAALADGRSVRRVLDGTTGMPPVFEVVRPLTLDGSRLGLLTIGFSTERMERAWQQDVRSGIVLAVTVLVAGALGMALIFYMQQRHLGEVRAVEMEMARRERLAALGDVAAAFAHEVRNPLNAVSMGLQRLRDEFTPEPAADYARFVDVMQGEVQRLNAIVEQFIALARPLPLAPAPMALDDVLRELAALVEGQARMAGMTVRLALPPTMPPIVADRDRLKQVLLNLVVNALQAMSTGGTLTLGAEVGRDHVAVAVTDSGPGIPPETLSRIFDPYFTTKTGGLGLGLTIARRIVEAHRGSLEAESQPGRGTTFRVRLPRGAA